MPAVFERSGLRSRGEKSMWNLRPAGSIDLEGGEGYGLPTAGLNLKWA
jgi:hypothetical protein